MRSSAAENALSETPCGPTFVSSAASMDWIDRHGSSGVLPSADKGRNARAYLSEMAMTSLSSCNDRANANTNYSVPLDVSPFGRPATVTSSPPL